MDSPDDRAWRPKVPSFWTWLAGKDCDGDRGISNVLNVWLPLHALIALLLSLNASASATDIARSAALPGAAILIGLAFGWAGRSASLLQDKNFSQFLIEYGPSPEGYVYSFQLAVLIVIIFIANALVLLTGGLDVTLGSTARDEFMNRWSLFFFGSLALRETWGIIYFVNKLTIQYYKVREHEISADDRGESR